MLAYQSSIPEDKPLALDKCMQVPLRTAEEVSAEILQEP